MFFRKITVFHGRLAPEEGFLVGYGAIIENYKLSVPIPSRLSLISQKKRKYESGSWQVFTPQYRPDESLYKQLIFALKYEGIYLLILKKLFDSVGQRIIAELVQLEPTSPYSRKIWFLYEWLFNWQLHIPDLKQGNFVSFVDDKLQFAVSEKRSSRHRIINNLPATPGFCALIYKTEKLQKYLEYNLQEQKNSHLKGVHIEIMQRASSFLLLKDSRA